MLSGIVERIQQCKQIKVTKKCMTILLLIGVGCRLMCSKMCNKNMRMMGTFYVSVSTQRVVGASLCCWMQCRLSKVLYVRGRQRDACL